MSSDGRGVAAMLAHPQRQRLQALDELKGVEGAHAATGIAQQHDAGADNVGDGSQRLYRLGPHGAVVTGVGLVERGDTLSVRRPIEGAAVDDDAADRGAVTADI